ncbi:hypothetical protein AVEN_219042-1 [Araneus ventricosus]|uniref:RNA-directed DNA polymerase n=1 Tax=Araneus ventricosus TaxID=182803 RepID=A0A4Y2VLU3_ARAVE|nr:hypothetical protein AVEN_219042-1 [Araneus ventricosus]
MALRVALGLPKWTPNIVLMKIAGQELLSEKNQEISGAVLYQATCQWCSFSHDQNCNPSIKLIKRDEVMTANLLTDLDTSTDHIIAFPDTLISRTVGKGEAHRILMETALQSLSHLWIEERRKRLNASNFVFVCNRLPHAKCDNIVKNILYSNFESSGMKYGKKHEKDAIEELKKMGIKIKSSGLFIDENLPFLAATPDGLIDDDGTVEIKCPSSCSDLTPEESILKRKITLRTIDKKNNKIKEPTTVKQVQSFLGLTGYFRKYIKDYSKISKPLSDLTRKENQFVFGIQQKEAFEKLKKIMSEGPVLRIYKYGRRTELRTDASKQGYGAVLGKLHPIYYVSKKTSPAEEKYDNYEVQL